MARRMLLIAALAAVALAPLASAQLNCYVTSPTLYPPPPPATIITGIPPISFTGIPPIAIPSARDFLITYLNTYGATMGPGGLAQYTIGTQIAVPSTGNLYSACISYSINDVSRSTSPSGADGIKVVEQGTMVGGINTDCNSWNSMNSLTAAATKALGNVAAVPWTWNSGIYQYTFVQESSSMDSYSCCSTNLCNSGSATVTTRLGAGAAIANMMLLVISAVACMVLSKML